MQGIITLLKQCFTSIQGQIISGLTAIVALLVGLINLEGQTLLNTKLSLELQKDEPSVQASYKICYPKCPYYNSENDIELPNQISSPREQPDKIPLQYPGPIFERDPKIAEDLNNLNSQKALNLFLHKEGGIYLVLKCVNKDRMGAVNIRFKQYYLESYIGFYKDNTKERNPLSVDVYNILDSTKAFTEYSHTFYCDANNSIVVPLAKIYSLDEDSKIGLRHDLIYNNVWIPLNMTFSDVMKKSSQTLNIQPMESGRSPLIEDIRFPSMDSPVFMYKL